MSFLDMEQLQKPLVQSQKSTICYLCVRYGPLTFGALRPMLREPLSLDIAYPIQWHESRVNLTELAKLRYIHGWSRQELARHYGRTLNAITNYCQSIRRKNFDLDGLTVEEKEQIKWAYQN